MSESGEWRPVVGYEGLYEVSDLGWVRSLPRRDAIGRQLTGRILKTFLSKGYPQVNLSRGVSPVRQQSRLVPHLVAEAFIGPRSDGMQIRHLDGNPRNNCAANLLYGTRSENQMDAIRHGTHPKSSRTHCPQGHPYDLVNTRWYGRRRYCRACHRARGTLSGGRKKETM